MWPGTGDIAQHPGAEGRGPAPAGQATSPTLPTSRAVAATSTRLEQLLWCCPRFSIFPKHGKPVAVAPWSVKRCFRVDFYQAWVSSWGEQELAWLCLSLCPSLCPGACRVLVAPPPALPGRPCDCPQLGSEPVGPHRAQGQAHDLNLAPPTSRCPSGPLPNRGRGLQAEEAQSCTGLFYVSPGRVLLRPPCRGR